MFETSALGWATHGAPLVARSVANLVVYIGSEDNNNGGRKRAPGLELHRKRIGILACGVDGRLAARSRHVYALYASTGKGGGTLPERCVPSASGEGSFTSAVTTDAMNATR